MTAEIAVRDTQIEAGPGPLDPALQTNRGSLTMTKEVAVRDKQVDAGPGPLDPALLQAIRPSAKRMAAAEDAFVRLLREDVRALVHHLPDRGRQLCERTARTVLWLALSDAPAETAIQSVHWLGEENQADGFPQTEYVTVGHALVRIARQMSGLEWTTTTGSAWIRLFMWLQPHLEAGARQQAARQEAARQQAARQAAALQKAAREQEAADREAARRKALDQAARRTAADADNFVLVGLVPRQDEPTFTVMSRPRQA